MHPIKHHRHAAGSLAEQCDTDVWLLKCYPAHQCALSCRYPNQWYVSSHMWGAGLQQKLKANILAKTGAPDPDHLK